MSIVNSIILFRDHKRQFPDREGLRRTVKYGVTSSRAEAVRKLCSFPEYDRPPLHDLSRPNPPPPPTPTLRDVYDRSFTRIF